MCFGVIVFSGHEAQVPLLLGLTATFHSQLSFRCPRCHTWRQRHIKGFAAWWNCESCQKHFLLVCAHLAGSLQPDEGLLSYDPPYHVVSKVVDMTTSEPSLAREIQAAAQEQ